MNKKKWIIGIIIIILLVFLIVCKCFINTSKITAYDLATESGYTGTKEEWLASLRGANGIDGINGINGLDGEDGAPGINGKNGLDGEDGAPGINGTNGLDGEDGLDGGINVIDTTTDTTITGILKGDGSNIAQAVPGVDYVVPGAAVLGGTTNNTTFGADGTMTLNGDATVWDDLRVQILTRTGSVAPSYTAGFGGNANLYAYSFRKDQTNNVYFEVQLPHTWAGTTVYPHVHWSPSETGTGNIRWILEYTWVNMNGTFGTSESYNMDSTVSTNSQWKHIVAHNETGIIPTVNQNQVSSMLICRLYRAGGVSPDTLNSNASLVAFDIHYEINSMGSNTITDK